MTIAAMICNAALLTAPFSPLPPSLSTLARMAICPVPDHRHPRYARPGSDPDFRCHLCLAALELAGRIDQHLCLDARRTTVLTVSPPGDFAAKTTRSARAFDPRGNLDLSYVIAMPLAMTYLVLRLQRPIAMRWGPWALAAGPVSILW